VIVYHVVRFRAPDYARWKQVFDGLEDVRVKHGGRGHRILRLLSDPDGYILLLDFTSAGGGEGFHWDPCLVEAIDDSGVEGGSHHVEYTVDSCEELEAVDRYEV
jgi:hypothetical protein